MKKLVISLMMMLLAVLACGAPSAGAPTLPPAPTNLPAPTSPPATVVEPTSIPATTVPPTQALASRRMLVESSDHTLSIYDVNGQSTPFGKTNLEILSGRFNLFGIDNGKVYTLGRTSLPDPELAYVLDGQREQQVAAITTSPGGLAVWPGDGSKPGKIAWDETGVQGSAATKLLAMDMGGSAGTVVYQQPFDTTQQRHAVPIRWSADGTHLYFSMEPYGLGGYIPFFGHSSLYDLDVASGTATEVIAPDDRRIICLDDLSPDFTLIGTHCDSQVGVMNLQTKQTTTITPPAEVPAGEARISGDIHFSPDGKRIVFAMAHGDPDNEQGWVAVTDDLSGTSRLVATSPAKELYFVLGWIDDNHILIEDYNSQTSNGVWGSLQVLALDGSQPKEIAPNSSFVTFVP